MATVGIRATAHASVPDQVSQDEPAKPSWKEICETKQGQRLARIPREWRLSPDTYRGLTNVIDIPETCGILTKEEIRITSQFDALDLVNAIKRGAFSAEAVTVAFCKRAAIAQQLVRFKPIKL